MIANPFALLELKKGASKEEVKAAYRRLAKRYHPDSPDGDKAKFQSLTTAYEDCLKEIEAIEKRKSAPHTAPPHPFEDIFTFDVDYGNGHKDTYKGYPFGARSPDFRTSVEIAEHLSLKDAILGCTRVITAGAITAEVTFHPGVLENEVLTIEAGRFVVNVRTVFIADNRFTVKGKDLSTMVRIPYQTFEIGGNVEVQSPDKTLSVSVPKWTEPGTIVKLKGLGIGYPRGDLYVRLEAKLPVIK